MVLLTFVPSFQHSLLCTHICIYSRTTHILTIKLVLDVEYMHRRSLSFSG